MRRSCGTTPDESSTSHGGPLSLKPPASSPSPTLAANAELSLSANLGASDVRSLGPILRVILGIPEVRTLLNEQSGSSRIPSVFSGTFLPGAPHRAGRGMPCSAFPQVWFGFGLDFLFIYIFSIYSPFSFPSSHPSFIQRFQFILPGWISIASLFTLIHSPSHISPPFSVSAFPFQALFASIDSIKVEN